MMLMKNYTFWKNNIDNNDCASINKNMDVDILIVGGGITGMSLLYHLNKSKLKTILVESNTCGQGVTSKSTAKITYLQEKQYLNIKTFINEEAASLYLKSQRDAVKLLVDIINKENISCDLELSPSYLFVNENRNLKKLNDEFMFLKNNGVNVEKVTDVPFNEKVLESIKVNDTYTFHPLKYINALKDKFKNNIYEHSKLVSINKVNDYYECLINDYVVKAKYVVIATHYPYFVIPFLMPLKSSIETSYIGVKKGNFKSNFNAINLDKPCISLRTYQNKYLVYLYQSFKSCNINDVKHNFDILNTNGPFDYIWTNKDIITNDSMPFIGRLKKNENLFIASGYNTWGITNGSLAGKILADIILNNTNP